MVRLETGKRSVTSSENEERGKGRREKRRRIHSDEPSSESEVERSSPAGKSSKRKSSESLNCSKQSSSLSLVKHQSFDTTPKATENLCPLPKSRHVCTFTHGESIEISLGKQLCSLSSKLNSYYIFNNS